MSNEPDTDPNPHRYGILVLGCDRDTGWGANLRVVISHLDDGVVGLKTELVGHPSGDRVIHHVTLDYTLTTGHIALDVAALKGFDVHLTDFAGNPV